MVKTVTEQDTTIPPKPSVDAGDMKEGQPTRSDLVEKCEQSTIVLKEPPALTASEHHLIPIPAEVPSVIFHTSSSNAINLLEDALLDSIRLG